MTLEPNSPLEKHASSGKHYKWEMLGWLSAAFFTHQAGRAVLGVVLPQIKESLHITDNSSMGLVSTCLSITLVIMIPLAGFLGDRFSRKWIITTTLIIGSAATALAGASVGLLTLILFYSVTSASCEALYAPSGYSLVAAFHKKTRAIALSIHQSALYIGIMSCGLLSGVIAQQWGWRWAFAIFGGMGVVLGVICIFRLKDAPSEKIRTSIEAKPEIKATLRVLLKNPSAILLTCGATSVIFVNVIYSTWAPFFVQQKFGLSMTQAGAYVFFYHYLAALVAILFGGVLTDKMVRKDPAFRLKMQSRSLFLGAPMILMIGFTKQVHLVWGFMAAYGIFRGLYEVNTQASLFDVVAPQHRATAIGLMAMTGFLVGGTVGPYLIGKLIDIYGMDQGMKIGFSLMAATYVIGSLAVGSALHWRFHRDRIIE